MRTFLAITGLVLVAPVVVGPILLDGPHAQVPAQGRRATITVVNPTGDLRSSETVTLSAADLQRVLGQVNLQQVHVRDAKDTDLLTQAVDVNDDGTFDELIFQTNLGSRERQRFSLHVGERRIPKREEFRAYGRFVRERRDDFAWENDLVAHRMYGAALETWAQEPLTSSGLDVWVKRTPRLIVNEWYMVDDYHRNNGEGADLYSAGRTRGCGGSGLWRDGKLYTSINFRNTRSLANGPIRVMFELMYEPWEVGGVAVRETKRITLDAGHHFNRFELSYSPGPGTGTQLGLGIKNNKGSTAKTDPQTGVLRAWEPLQQEGYLGCAVIAAPGTTSQGATADGNYLLLASMPQQGPAVYYAGSAWDKAGEITSAEAWDAYLAREAARLRTPVVVNLDAN
jgi:hypothetical protein